MGDSKAYFLSTAQNHLGVISAVSSVSGLPLGPISWQEMADEDGRQRDKDARRFPVLPFSYF